MSGGSDKIHHQMHYERKRGGDAAMRTGCLGIRTRTAGGGLLLFAVQKGSLGSPLFCGGSRELCNGHDNDFDRAWPRLHDSYVFNLF